MRRIISVGIVAALAAALMLLPGTASARKHRSTCPRSARVDRNHDRIPDRWECRHHLSLKVKQTRRDPDHDGLNNLGEFKAGDDPHKADTDGDGVNDGNEHAGTIQSFVADAGSPNTGTLTIALDGDGTVSGKVTGDTECKVESPATAKASSEGESGAEHGDTPQGTSGENQGEKENENENENQNEQGENATEHACTGADLTGNRVVREAELKVTSAGAIFEEIKLG